MHLYRNRIGVAAAHAEDPGEAATFLTVRCADGTMLRRLSGYRRSRRLRPVGGAWIRAVD